MEEENKEWVTRELETRHIVRLALLRRAISGACCLHDLSIYSDFKFDLRENLRSSAI